MMPSNEEDDEHYIAGAHGTIAEQKDEAFYDDRSDADDDMEKGRITFPKGIYGRDRELETLQGIYDNLVSLRNYNQNGNEKKLSKNNSRTEEDDLGHELKEKATAADAGAGGDKSALPEAQKPQASSLSNKYKHRVVFLSGYSGVGKSALAREFVKQVQSKYYASSKYDDSPILYISGKCPEQSTATAPFSGVIEMLARLTSYLSHKTDAEDEAEENKTIGLLNNLRSKVWTKINQSELIQPGTEGDRILRGTFPILAPLLDSCCRKNDLGHDTSSPSKKLEDNDGGVSAHHSMNAIKECTLELFSAVCEALEHPLILFWDDLQWGDEPSIEMLSFLLSSTDLQNVMFLCAYRSNEVDTDHSFAKLMERVTASRSSDKESSTLRTVENMDLFSLSPEMITKFIADCVKKEEPDDVSELAEVVYQKTMGNIFFVRQALEELVRKNILFYDIMCFDWRWVVSKAELSNYVSDDVVETVKGKIRELSSDIQSLLVVMAYLPNTLDSSMIMALMINHELASNESTITDLLKRAMEEGMLFYSVESGNYVIAHDRIRQASLEFAAEKNQDDMLLHISTVLLEQAQGKGREWCLFVAVDILNNLPPHKAERRFLAKLNLGLSKIARRRGCSSKENGLLLNSLKCLKSTGTMWKYYSLSYELHNAIIVSEYSTGSFDKANAAIDEVVKHAKTLNEKLNAYVHQVICRCDQTRDYSQGVEDGLKVLKLYGYEIPVAPTKMLMIKEGTKFKMALRNRSYSCLANLPVADVPIVVLFRHITRYAVFASKDRILRLLAWKSIECALTRNGMDRNLPRIMAWFGGALAKQGKNRQANEVGTIALALSEKIRDDKEHYALAQVPAYATTVCILQSFHNSIDKLFQCYKDLRLMGNVESALGSMLTHCQAYFAAGLQLGPLLESKLYLVEEYCRDVDRTSFLISFQIYRQFALNLRKRTGNPTEFRGEVFHEEEILSAMSGSAHSMVLRDSSIHRLQLAFIFLDEDTMADMLNILASYPLADHLTPRLHNRLCFTGLAAIALGSKSFKKLGQKCLKYFSRLEKNGSVNARPVYLFMLAMKSPNRKAFKKAIDACVESKFIHLTAMAKERYAMFLNTDKDKTLANDNIISAYWLYQDWGAYAKALELSKEYNFLKNCKRRNANTHMTESS